MAKDVKATQKKNTSKKETKTQPKKSVEKEEKVVTKKEKNIKEKVSKEVVKETVKKEEIKKTVDTNDKFDKVNKVIDNNSKAILFGIVGFLLATLLFRFILWPERIATLADGTQPVFTIDGEAYTADDLYEKLKSTYSIDALLNEVDNKILVEMYPEDEAMTKEVKSQAEYYYSAYKSYYGYTKEQFLEYYGFANEEAFLESLTLDHRRKLYYEKYTSALVSEEEIKEYYDTEVYGDIDSKHILVKVDSKSEDGLSDSEAKALAKEIIKELNSGKTWDEVIKKYEDKIVDEELGYNAFNANLEQSYLDECRKLEVGKYSSSPVATSYGYHIVYKIDQKEKPSLDEVKEDIIDIFVAKLEKKDTNLSYKSLIKLREDAKVEFVDSRYVSLYDEYVKQYK